MSPRLSYYMQAAAPPAPCNGSSELSSTHHRQKTKKGTGLCQISARNNVFSQWRLKSLVGCTTENPGCRIPDGYMKIKAVDLKQLEKPCRPRMAVAIFHGQIGHGPSLYSISGLNSTNIPPGKLGRRKFGRAK